MLQDGLKDAGVHTQCCKLASVKPGMIASGKPWFEIEFQWLTTATKGAERITCSAAQCLPLCQA